MCASVRRWQQSIFDTAGHDLQLLMMYTRAAFYATEPGNAAAYAPVEACGAHEWSYIAHGWRAVSTEPSAAEQCEPRLPLSVRLRGGGTEDELRHASAHGQEGKPRTIGPHTQ